MNVYSVRIQVCIIFRANAEEWTRLRIGKLFNTILLFFFVQRFTFIEPTGIHIYIHTYLYFYITNWHKLLIRHDFNALLNSTDQ